MSRKHDRETDKERVERLIREENAERAYRIAQNKHHVEKLDTMLRAFYDENGCYPWQSELYQ